MNWNEFKTQLENHSEQLLQFQYNNTQIVRPGFHITEIKQAHISSVDCGGKPNTWTEIIVQLWEPVTEKKGQEISGSKALSIIKTVEELLAIHPTAPVKIEFGNDTFDTRQMHIHDFHTNNNTLILSLTPDKTQCKAIDRGETCGTTKPKIKLSELKNQCEPSGGCC